MKKSLPTKERLLKAACGVFAEKGYRDTTVADICEAAEANIAAVNYHFGDKETLYEAVWRKAFEMAASAYPLDKNLPPAPSAEDLLFCYASAILHRIFMEDETGYFAKMLYFELASPTLALDRIAEEALTPQNKYLAEVIHQLLGDGVDDHSRRFCMHSIIGQCAFFNFSRPLRGRVLGKVSLNEEEIAKAARHIARFSLGGIKELRS